jgi:hypothetical protein
MKHRALDEVYCSVARSWSVLGDRWTMLVLREAFAGTSRYDRFQARPELLALMEWSDRYKVENPPVKLFRKACGAQADPQLVCRHCAEPVAYGDLHAEYAPDAW